MSVVRFRSKPAHFFRRRYRVAHAVEMGHCFDAVDAVDAVDAGKLLRTSIDDGVKALELAQAATTSWRAKRIVTL